RALARTTTGNGNTAVGDRALQTNVTGLENTAIGAEALAGATGDLNVAVGVGALTTSEDSSANVAVGDSALPGIPVIGDSNTAIGHRALGTSTAFTGSNNIALGDDAGLNLNSGDNNIYIGNSGFNESNTIRIGECVTQ